MVLSYTNYICNHILKQNRNLRHVSSELVFGSNNNIEEELDLVVDIRQLILQANVFAKEMVAHNSIIDLKRNFGPFTRDWERLLHETYIYDRARCIFYGINSSRIHSINENCYCFPGNLLLMQMMSNINFTYDIEDPFPLRLSVKLSFQNNAQEFLENLFKLYPSVKVGMSRSFEPPHYYNEQYEGYLRGLNHFINANAAQSNNNRSSGNNAATTNVTNVRRLFQLENLNSDKAKEWCKKDSNPILNSYLSRNRSDFFFLLPTDKSGSDALKWNESIFISRAIGITKDTKIVSYGNEMNMSVDRDIFSDMFTKEEVYAVTALKSEIHLSDPKDIKAYLMIHQDTEHTWEEGDPRWVIFEEMFRKAFSDE